jgi:hypothetical protein
MGEIEDRGSPGHEWWHRPDSQWLAGGEGSVAVARADPVGGDIE